MLIFTIQGISYNMIYAIILDILLSVAGSILLNLYNRIGIVTLSLRLPGTLEVHGSLNVPAPITSICLSIWQHK